MHGTESPSVESHVRYSRNGFTLIELLIVVGIIGALAGLVAPSFQRYTDRARVASATGDLRTLQTEIAGYLADTGALPTSLADIGRDGFLDPWNRPYVFVSFVGLTGAAGKRKDRFLVPINSDYDLFSLGKDGKSMAPLTAQMSLDDVVRANDGGFIGLATSY